MVHHYYSEAGHCHHHHHHHHHHHLPSLAVKPGVVVFPLVDVETLSSPHSRTS